MKDNNTLPESYGKFFKEYNIKYADCKDDLPENFLPVTGCSGKKFDVEYATPKNLYDSRRVQRFCKICEQAERRYCIFSDMYGLVKDDEEIKNYETPMPLPEGIKKRNAKKLSEYKEKPIVFYYDSPLMARMFLQQFAMSGIEFYYISDSSLLL